MFVLCCLQILASVDQGAVAVAAATQLPEQRVVVDEYHATIHGNYKLHRVGTDLISFLQDQQLGVALVPDVQVALHAHQPRNSFQVGPGVLPKTLPSMDDDNVTSCMMMITLPDDTNGYRDNCLYLLSARV